VGNPRAGRPRGRCHRHCDRGRRNAHGCLGDLDDREALIVQFGRGQLRKKEVTDETFRGAADWLGDTGINELTATFCYYSMFAVVPNRVEVMPDEDAPTLK